MPCNDYPRFTDLSTVELGGHEPPNHLLFFTRNGTALQGATFPGGAGATPCGNGDYRSPDGLNNGDERGIHVAGIIAAVTDNGIGVAGTAPDAMILSVKVLEDGSAEWSI